MARTKAPQRDPQDVQLNVWMPASLRVRLHAVAAREDRTAAQILRGLTRDYVEAREVETGTE